jgi:hypothetical protein
LWINGIKNTGGLTCSTPHNGVAWLV